MPTRFNPDPDLIRKLAEVINETGLTEIEFAEGDRRIRVARNVVSAAAAVPAMASVIATAGVAPAPAAAEESSTRNAIVAPMVGTAYLAPEPSAANFVKPGDRVSEGQTLLIIEAMKVMNPIKSPRAGVVKALLVENAAPVEYGQPLLVVE
ncbi:MAG: acetyl-CoA carboxylase biotin carboxyl carrier protein [Alphaproteobacteria bacterium]|nr:acetyl-CoA carboxylase biotin carboxyl carrier protein [Alphaproteobacteria bacterium]